MNFWLRPTPRSILSLNSFRISIKHEGFSRHFSVCQPLLRRRRTHGTHGTAQKETNIKLSETIAEQKQIIRRVSYFVNAGFPSSAVGYFHKKLSSGRLARSLRPQVFEDTLQLLLGCNAFPEVLSVSGRMRSEGVIPSLGIQGRLLSIGYTQNKSSQEDFLNAIKVLFLNARTGFEDDIIHDILCHLEKTDSPSKILEETTRVFLDSQQEGHRLHPKSVALLIKHYIGIENEANADSWLDYHSERPLAPHTEDADSRLLPYRIYLNGMVDLKKNSSLVCGPILERMTKDGVYPNVDIINSMIFAELRFGKSSAAFGIYDTLRTHNARSVYPNEETFHLLYTAAAKAGANKAPDTFPVSPRQLFREMFELHILMKKWIIDTKWPVTSSRSLAAALSYFLAANDYAAAYVVIDGYRMFRIPFEESVTDLVMETLIKRCKDEIAVLTPASPAVWAEAFTNTMGIRASGWKHFSRLRKESKYDMLQRVLHNVETNTAGRLVSSNKNASLREKKLQTMRERKLQFMQSILSHALVSTFVSRTDSAVMMEELAAQELTKAFGDMYLDNISNIMSSAYAPKYVDICYEGSKY